MDMDTLRFTLDANTRLCTPGLKSQSCRSCASQRDAIIAAQDSRDTISDAGFSLRLYRGCFGKSGPPTHHGSVMLNTRGKYAVLNWSISVEPVCKANVENSANAFIRLASTSLFASESRCATRICGLARFISLSNWASECRRSAGVAALSTPRYGASSSFSSKSSRIPAGIEGSSVGVIIFARRATFARSCC